MSVAKIRRGGTARVSRPRNGRGSGRALRKQSLGDRLLAALPVSEATVQKMASWAIVALALGAAGGIAQFFGLPAMLRQEAVEMAARAGFEVKKVEVRGIARMDEMQVYNLALGQVDRSMLALDLDTLRGGLMDIGWIKDARVSRRLPATLVVDIVEREPVAVWQTGGKLSLIDVEGVVLEPVEVAAMPDLPLVIGPAANRQTAALARLMDTAPALKPILAGATWVGDRRWDLRFQSGETLSLPEGVKEASAALLNFARMDGVNRLLGRGIVRFDMRDPDKMILRLPTGQAGTAKEVGLDTSAPAADQEGDRAEAVTDASGATMQREG